MRGTTGTTAFKLKSEQLEACGCCVFREGRTGDRRLRIERSSPNLIPQWSVFGRFPAKRGLRPQQGVRLSCVLGMPGPRLPGNWL